MIKKEYTLGDLTVVWQPHLCIHSAICFRSLPAVFKPRERPWIQLQEGVTQDIKDTVNACPSGALSLKHTVLEEIKVEGLKGSDTAALKQQVYELMETALIKYKASWIK